MWFMLDVVSIMENMIFFDEAGIFIAEEVDFDMCCFARVIRLCLHNWMSKSRLSY